MTTELAPESVAVDAVVAVNVVAACAALTHHYEKLRKLFCALHTSVLLWHFYSASCQQIVHFPQFRVWLNHCAVRWPIRQRLPRIWLYLAV